MKRGAVIALGSIGAVFIGGGIASYFLFFKKDDKGKTFMQRRKERQDKTENEDTSDNGSTSTTTTSISVSEFPLRNGSIGNNVKKLQIYLGVTSDGIFGSNTESALYAKTGKKTMSKSEFDSFVLKGVIVSETSNTKASKLVGKYPTVKFSASPIYGALRTSSGAGSTSAIPAKTNQIIGYARKGEQLGEVTYGDDTTGDVLIKMRTGIYSSAYKLQFTEVWFNKAYL